MPKDIHVVMVGYGKVMKVIARYLKNEEDFALLPFALVERDVSDEDIALAIRAGIELIYPHEHDAILVKLKREHGDVYAVDFTAPAAVIQNAERYIRLKIPFLMGTTGGNRKLLEQMIRESSIAAVVAPNMASEIVMLDAMLAWSAEIFDKPLRGWQLLIEETHQEGKKDPSGTADKMSERFRDLGVHFDKKDPDQFIVIRNRIRALKKGVPVEALGGHGFHEYFLVNPSGTMFIRLEHNIVGREPYGPNVVKGLHFLGRKVTAGETGFFSMIDVLKK